MTQQSTWEAFSKELSAEVAKAYPYAVSIGVGTLSKDVTPKKKFLGRKPERQYADHVHVLVLDRPVPQSEWVGVSGGGYASPAGIQAMQQNFKRSLAIRAIDSFCGARGLPFEYHFAPCAFVELGPAVIESIRRTSMEAAQRAPAVPNNRAARRNR